MKQYIHENFMLHSEPAVRLYHDYAKEMPIIDYHNHLSPMEISDNQKYNDITKIWLGSDHYKWRAMRGNGIDEKFITGNAPSREKFKAWGKTMEVVLRNPLFVWAHMELLRYFGIDDLLLTSTTSDIIYDTCNELLKEDKFFPRRLIDQMNVEVLCTTDDPVDSLDYHNKVNSETESFKIYPTWRPDKAFKVDNADSFNSWVDALSKIADIDISTFDNFLNALTMRHDYFHDQGCRISDYGLDQVYSEDFSESEVKDIFTSVRSGNEITLERALRFKSAMIFYFCSLDYDKNWVQQLHIGALRNTNSQYYDKLGPDSGFDSIDDRAFSKDLLKLLDRLDFNGTLAKTVIYPMNPAFNSVVATMAGNFQDGKVPGKIQFGSAWWFLDQKDGIEDQLNILSNMGVLGRFVGMTTDSRSILSFVRHEYFRRIFCNLIGNDMQKGLLPVDFNLIGSMVQDICYNNAKEYFCFK